MNVFETMKLYQQMRQNPAAFLSNYGIPSNMANDPQAVIQHLMNTGRVSQDQYNQAMQMADSFKKMMR